MKFLLSLFSSSTPSLSLSSSPSSSTSPFTSSFPSSLSEMNCPPACYICHNQRWSPKKRQEKVIIARPLKWKFSSQQHVQPSFFPPPFPSKKTIQRKSSHSKTKVSRSDFFNNERATEESKCVFIFYITYFIVFL